jgi:REP element-mobilizing transposase RayT
LVISTNNRRATARVAPTLSQIIGAFKSKCVIDYLRFIRNNQLNEIGKIWQRNYYERIIRDKEELDKFRKYIRNNPYKWAEDENNPVNIERRRGYNLK